MIAKNLYLAVAVTFLLSGCSFLSNNYEDPSRAAIDYLLSDLPIPDDAEIQKVPTVILGTGTGIAGRVILDSPKTPAENLIFYSEKASSTGWQLVSSTVAEEIVLTYTKAGRYATIEILRPNELSVFFSDSESLITISVVHPNSVQLQNPYLGSDIGTISR
ncbi:hypothetical protein N9Y15_02610 [Alphaproteobacteria bacterium]|nr:hypothetical protein [Alphaproteobacteria bacterium]MDB2575080.1 hypothetical protein [Alphaproteobacteria bacterium]MDB2656006.1 hypothetical protein [Alphaproteobacteria bacterium]